MGRCCVCELQKKKHLCAACFNQSAESRRQDVAALSSERDEQLSRLQEALALKARCAGVQCSCSPFHCQAGPPWQLPAPVKVCLCSKLVMLQPTCLRALRAGAGAVARAAGAGGASRLAGVAPAHRRARGAAAGLCESGSMPLPRRGVRGGAASTRFFPASRLQAMPSLSSCSSVACRPSDGALRSCASRTWSARYGGVRPTRQ